MVMWPVWAVMSSFFGLLVLVGLNVGDGVPKGRICWAVEQSLVGLTGIPSTIISGFEGVRHLIASLGVSVFLLSFGGLIPGVASWMGQIYPPVLLSLASWGMMVALSVWLGGLKSLMGGSVPSSVPGYLAPIFSVLDLVGVALRPITLTVRVVVNVVAGHVMTCMCGWLILYSLNFYGWTGVLLKVGTLLSMAGVKLFEFFVCGVQGYVFAMLVALYCTEAMGSSLVGKS